MEIVKMNNEILNNIKSDLELLKRDKFHQKHEDLINMVFLEDIPELIKFVEKVNEIFENNQKQATGDYMSGYYDCFDNLKKELYGK